MCGKRYTEKFKVEANKQVLDHGCPVDEAPV
ncbi:hypothetical protein DFR37_10878 [Eoetvoesiella caeni]|uniref:Transposase n=1 Tax=Eoetvoesiella caeni TaxID=645616 RepID=A0A366H9U1_9BURK|nr:hypothetical protein DFR37_10878 [Eoetvoesiella caeni]